MPGAGLNVDGFICTFDVSSIKFKSRDNVKKKLDRTFLSSLRQSCRAKPNDHFWLWLQPNKGLLSFRALVRQRLLLSKWFNRVCTKFLKSFEFI